MRITMLTIGSTGDVRPYVLLGRELSSRGHQITIAAFSRFQEMILESGLRFHPLSGSAENMMAAIMNPNSGSLSYLPRLVKSLKTVLPQLLRDLSDSCSDAEAMICNYFGSIYYSVAEKYDIPCVQTHFFPMDPTGNWPISAVRNQQLGPFLNRASYKLGYFLISSAEKRYFSSWRRGNGVSVRHISVQPDYHAGTHPVPVIYAVSPLIFPRPGEWDERIRMSGFWFDESPAEWIPPKDLEDFLSADGTPPLYIGFGSMTGRGIRHLMPIVLRAVHAARVRAVIQSGWGETSLSSTRDVFFGSYFSHDWLFPRVRAVVHHGGAGTTAAGLRYGRPTLTVPFAGDQCFWGYRVWQAGCGPKPIPRDRLTAEKMRDALLDLVSRPEYAVSARNMMRGLAREHGIRTAADTIEKEIACW